MLQSHMPASFYSREVIAFIIYVQKAISTAMSLACETLVSEKSAALPN